MNEFVSNSGLAGTTASSYGFAVSSTGLASATLNVGNAGVTFGVNDNATLTVSELLWRANARAVKGLMWNVDGSGKFNSSDTILRNQASTLLDQINNL